MNTEVRLSGSADGLRGFRVAGAWFSGAGAVYRPPLIVSRDIGGTAVEEGDIEEESVLVWRCSGI
jgi:hypothetical protein